MSARKPPRLPSVRRLSGLDETVPPLDLLSWTERHRVIRGARMTIPGPLRALYADDTWFVVVMKGAQMGLSEYGINEMLHTADTRRAGRGNALFVQPTGDSIEDFVEDFVEARVLPAFDESQYLESRRGTPDNTGLIRLGDGFVYWRASGSTTNLKSVDADLVVLDEFDEMAPGVYELARHRLDSSTDPRMRILSTPTFPGTGIEPLFLAGDQRRFLLTCTRCSAEQDLDWERNVVDARRVCATCHASLEDVVAAAWAGQGGRWHAGNPLAKYHSYHLSQLYRPRTDLRAVAAELADSSIHTRTQAVNQYLGEPFSPEGGQLSQEELTRVTRAPFDTREVAGIQDCWMGIDVGTRLHCVIRHRSDRWDGVVRNYVVAAVEVDTFDEAAALMHRFGVAVCVVDALPEVRAVFAFQQRFPGQVYAAHYVEGQAMAITSGGQDPTQYYRLTLDRTVGMDTVAAEIRGGAVLFPSDAASIPGFFAHLKAPVRLIEPGANGIIRARYREGARPDHYFHAAVYAHYAQAIYDYLMEQRRTRYDSLSESEIQDRLAGALSALFQAEQQWRG